MTVREDLNKFIHHNSVTCTAYGNTYNIGRRTHNKGDFGLFYTIPRDVGLLYPTTDIIDTYVYRGLRTGSDIGITTAVGLFQSAVGLVMVIATNLVVKRFRRKIRYSKGG